MIVAITHKTQHGRQGKVGIDLLPELSNDSVTAYGHSTDEAVAWAKSYPTFADVEPESLGDGRIRFVTEWKAERSVYGAVIPEYEKVTHIRQEIVIEPLNTIFVNSGFRGGSE